MARLHRAVAIGLGLVLVGCVGPPDFDTPSPLTVTQVVNHILCEVLDAKRAHPELKQWTAVANLFLQVDDSGSIAPTLTYMHPMAMMTSFMLGGTATIKQDRTRIFSDNFQIQIGSLDDKVVDCRPPTEEFNLNGDLGIKEIVDVGFSALLRHIRAGSGGSGKFDAFGETVTFTLTNNKSVSALGPTWTLKHFKGPGGLLSGSRADQHKLIISFGPNDQKSAKAIALEPLFRERFMATARSAKARAEAEEKAAAAAAAESAADAAAQNNINMLLQSTLGNLRVLQP